MWMPTEGPLIGSIVHVGPREKRIATLTMPQPLLSLSLCLLYRCRASGRPDRGDRRIPLFVPEAFRSCVCLRWPWHPAGNPVFDVQHLQRQRPVGLQSAAPACTPFVGVVFFLLCVYFSIRINLLFLEASFLLTGSLLVHVAFSPFLFVLPLAPGHSSNNCSKNEVVRGRGRLRLKGLGSPPPVLPPPHASLKH